MKLRWNSICKSVLSLAFVGAMGFGAMQAMASPTDSGTNATCNAWACRAECGSFGGELGPGGPGKPLQCYCCG